MRMPPLKSALCYGITLFTSARGADGLSDIIGPSWSPVILWKPCPEASPFECGSFQVPLDYAHPEVGSATLALARLRATRYPRHGTIFTNPGGPGNSGVQFLLGRAGKIISTITDGSYDIVSWDPRGVGQSSPQISCGFTSLDTYDSFLENTTSMVGFEAQGNFIDQDDIHAFFAKVKETDAKLLQMGQRCLVTDGGFLKYMGTAAVVRDMVSLSDSIDGAGMPINYWGFSYGTVIGNYFVNMFPHRVGRVVFDGVVDSITWATMPTYKIFAGSLSGSESALEGFAEKCSEAGPRNCAMGQEFSTATSILQIMRDLINKAYELKKANRSETTSFDIRAFLESELYTPLTWTTELVPQLDAWRMMFENATIGNATAEVRASRSRRSSRRSTSQLQNTVDPTVQAVLSELVISCVDSIDQGDVTTKQVFQEVVRVTHNVAPTFGEVTLVTGQMFCHRFPVRAIERFTGPFNRNLVNPIIVIGNRADPVTPVMNAQKIAMRLGSSARLVVQDGIGHTSLAENSDCTQAVVRNYFMNGELPPAGLVCKTDQALFPPNRTLISENPHDL